MKNLKKLVQVLLLVVLVVAFSGCTKEEVATPGTDVPATETPAADAPATETPATETPAESGSSDLISGTVVGSGSTSTEKVIVAVMNEFMALNPDVVATYESMGSSAGVLNGHEGNTEFGSASRDLKPGEKEWGQTEVVFAYDGIALAVHPDNTSVEDLTLEQIIAIYTGEISDWSEVGGDAGAIVVVSREDGSGTRGAFEEILDIANELRSDALIGDGNGNVKSSVAGNPSAIGYISFTSVDDTVKALKVNGADPTNANVLNSSYPVSRPFVICYHEANMGEAALAYIDFLMSSEGQEVVAENGGIPVK